MVGDLYLAPIPEGVPEGPTASLRNHQHEN